MENIKITVLRLSGCGWCGEITKQLTDLGIEFKSLDADKESDLADRWESLLDTLLYPIIQVDRPIDTWYIFRPQNEKDLGKIVPMGFKNFKLGCNTIADIVNEVKKLSK